MINDLASKLTTLRKRNNLTQSQLAERLGISPSIASSYETGVRQPSLEVLIKLAQFYHCSTDFLLGLESPIDNQIFANSLDTTGLTDKQIAILKELIDSMR